MTVVQTAAPDFPISALIPFISLFAVGNSALINMMMASRLLYGMSKRGVLPSFLSKVHSKRQTPFAAILFTTAIALVNVSVLVLRRDTVDHEHFRTPTALPVLGVIVCVYLVLPWSSGRPAEQYEIAGVLLGIGVVLWAVGRLVRARVATRRAE